MFREVAFNLAQWIQLIRTSGLTADAVLPPLLLFSLLNFVFCIIILIRQNAFKRKQRDLFMGKDGQSLEDIIIYQGNQIEILSKGFSGLANTIELLEKSGRKVLKRQGFVRYNAFKDTSGDMSYSLALLDDGGNGYVISGIFSRAENRTYVKQILNWKGEAGILTEEEEQSIRQAYRNEI